MNPRLSTSVPVASRVSGFTYAIRNIVGAARQVEAAGRRVRYLNIGDPVPFGFQTPPELIDAVARAMRQSCNGYGPSPGIKEGREAVAADYTRQRWPMSPDRTVLTAGTSEGIELALCALVEPGDEVLVPVPTYPLYTAVIAKLGARAVFYRTDPESGWLPDVDQIGSLVGPRTRALVLIDPNNPTGAVYPTEVRRALIDIAELHGIAILADEVYADLAYGGPIAPLGSLAPDAAIISFSSLSKAYIAPGWRAGWLAVGRSERLDDVLAAILKLADGRLCSTVPMQYAIAAALNGARAHQPAFRKALADRAAITTDRLNAIPGMSCVAPRGAFYAMPRVNLPPGRTDEEFVLALLRETGVLCVYGSGFGTVPEDGYFRVVFLAPPQELAEIYDLIASFSSRYLAQS